MDAAQIPPVNRLDCLPFKAECPFNLLRLELKQIMRQKGKHPIVDAGMQLRTNLNAGIPVPNIKTHINTDGNGIILLDKRKPKILEHVLKQYFVSKEYEENTDYVKCIAWTNARVKKLNQIVRSLLFKNTTDTYVIGESLIANKALFNRVIVERGRNTYINYAIKATTSDEFIVKHVSTIERTFKERGNKTLFSNFNITLKFWQLQCKTKGNSNITLFCIHPDDVEKYKKHMREAYNIAKKERTSETWTNYYNILKWHDDVVYNYAITAHKS